MMVPRLASRRRSTQPPGESQGKGECDIQALEEALRTAARLVVLYGDAYGHTLERLEQELTQRRQATSLKDRARRILAAAEGDVAHV